MQLSRHLIYYSMNSVPKSHSSSYPKKRCPSGKQECRIEWCTKPVYNNTGPYCFKHSCPVEQCVNHSSCPTHSCLAPGCHELRKGSEFSFCSDHSCPVETCDYPRLLCIKHRCITPLCDCPAAYPSTFCNYHICSTQGCRQGKASWVHEQTLCTVCCLRNNMTGCFVILLLTIVLAIILLTIIV